MPKLKHDSILNQNHPVFASKYLRSGVTRFSCKAFLQRFEVSVCILARLVSLKPVIGSELEQ